MRAVLVVKNGVEILEVEIPTPNKNEVLVKVFSCGLNRADLMVADGGVHGSSGGTGTIVGMEFSGEVIEFGNEVKGLIIGDRVMCSGSSAWAEYAIALGTMHNAIITIGQFQKGQSILIQGASSGVGLMALQIAKYMEAKIVIGTSTKLEKYSKLKEIGADFVVNSKDLNWVQQVLDMTNGEGVDLIIDQLSGYTVNQNMAATKIKGNIVNVGRLAGGEMNFNCDLHALRRINYKGVTFRTRSLDEVRKVYSNMWNDFKSLIIDRTFSLPIEKTFDFEEVELALSYMRENKHFGKLILKL